MELENDRNMIGFMIMMSTMTWATQIKVTPMLALFLEVLSYLTLVEEELEEAKPEKVTHLFIYVLIYILFMLFVLA